MLEEYFCITGELIPQMSSTSYEIFNWALQACVLLEPSNFGGLAT